jgi:hypothetical protein
VRSPALVFTPKGSSLKSRCTFSAVALQSRVSLPFDCHYLLQHVECGEVATLLFAPGLMCDFVQTINVSHYLSVPDYL